MEKDTLFRKEAVQHVSRQPLGSVVIAQPLSLTVLTLFILIVVIVAGVFLWIGEYARKQTVQGYLEPSLGVVEVYSKSSGGLVQDVFVTSGEEVKQGSPLISIRYPSVSSTVGAPDALAQIMEALKEQKNKLLDQRALKRTFYAEERVSLRARIQEVIKEIAQQQQYLRLHQNLMAVSEKQFESRKQLYDKGVLARSQWLESRSAQLEQQKERVSIEQRLTQLNAAKRDATRELESLTAKETEQALQLDLKLSETRQRLSQIAAEHTEVIVASITGYVTAVQTKVGGKASQRISLLSIVPTKSSLEAILHVPSSSMGFLAQNQAVRLTLDAYPHQQFGTLTAKIVSVAQAPIAANKLDGPLIATGSVFLVKAKLEKQTMLAIGHERQLQPGMLVRADIILERRSLIDWLLEPLYNLRGRNV